MKKLLLSLLSLSILLVSFAGCATQDDKTIVVGASITPHAEILEQAKPILEEKGYTLEIKEFTDYVQPNLTLDSKELDANFFQHLPYLEDFNVKNGTDIVSAAAIHYEPLGLYPGKAKTIDELKDGSIIAVPNDTTNEARALLLLETLGIIKIDPKAGLSATPNDITENNKKIVIKEIEAAQLPRSLGDVDLAVINGNYAILAGLDVSKDSIAKEEKDSLSATTYANIIAVNAGDEKREDIKALIEALKSDAIKKFIEEKYKGTVVVMY